MTKILILLNIKLDIKQMYVKLYSYWMTNIFVILDLIYIKAKKMKWLMYCLFFVFRNYRWMCREWCSLKYSHDHGFELHLNVCIAFDKPHLSLVLFFISSFVPICSRVIPIVVIVVVVRQPFLNRTFAENLFSNLFSNLAHKFHIYSPYICSFAWIARSNAKGIE